MRVLRFSKEAYQRARAYNNNLPVGHNRKDRKAVKCRIAIMGGFGSGKTFTAIFMVMEHLLRHKTQAIIGRRTATGTEKTLRSDIIDKWSDFIVSAKKDHILLTNGSEIHLVHAYDDTQGVKHIDGYNVSAYFISQAEQCPVDSIEKYESRGRNTSANDEILEVIDGNPNGKDWIWERYCHGRQPKTKNATIDGLSYSWTEWEGQGSDGVDTLCLSIPTQNFPWVIPKYLESQIAGKSQRWIDRYVLGKFDTYSGIVYDCFSEREHVVKHFDIREDLDKDRYCIVAGIDWGLRNPTAVLFALYDRVDDSYYFYKEYYEAGRTVNEVGEILRGYGITPDYVTMDPSAFARDPRGGKSIADILMDSTGWRIDPAENTADTREEVYRYLAEKRILISDALEKMIWEMTHYTYGDDLDKPSRTDPREEPKKKNDHAMDALKYILAMRYKYKVRPNDMRISRKT